MPKRPDYEVAHLSEIPHTPTDGDPSSRYALVIVSAKRARQINNYHHQLGEGMGLEDAPPPLAGSAISSSA